MKLILYSLLSESYDKNYYVLFKILFLRSIVNRNVEDQIYYFNVKRKLM